MKLFFEFIPLIRDVNLPINGNRHTLPDIFTGLFLNKLSVFAYFKNGYLDRPTWTRKIEEIRQDCSSYRASLLLHFQLRYSPWKFRMIQCREPFPLYRHQTQRLLALLFPFKEKNNLNSWKCIKFESWNKLTGDILTIKSFASVNNRLDK